MRLILISLGCLCLAGCSLDLELNDLNHTGYAADESANELAQQELTTLFGEGASFDFAGAVRRSNGVIVVDNPTWSRTPGTSGRDPATTQLDSLGRSSFILLADTALIEAPDRSTDRDYSVTLLRPTLVATLDDDSATTKPASRPGTKSLNWMTSMALAGLASERLPSRLTRLELLDMRLHTAQRGYSVPPGAMSARKNRDTWNVRFARENDLWSVGIERHRPGKAAFSRDGTTYFHVEADDTLGAASPSHLRLD